MWGGSILPDDLFSSVPKGSLAALEAEEFGVALGNHHIDVGDFHLAVNVGLVSAIRVAGSQAAASAVVAAAISAARER